MIDLESILRNYTLHLFSLMTDNKTQKKKLIIKLFGIDNEMVFHFKCKHIWLLIRFLPTINH